VTRVGDSYIVFQVVKLDDSELQNMYLILAFPIAKAVLFSGFRTSSSESLICPYESQFML
jgi:hypothetical protein